MQPNRYSWVNVTTYLCVLYLFQTSRHGRCFKGDNSLPLHLLNQKTTTFRFTVRVNICSRQNVLRIFIRFVGFYLPKYLFSLVYDFKTVVLKYDRRVFGNNSVSLCSPNKIYIEPHRVRKERNMHGYIPLLTRQPWRACIIVSIKG